MKNIQKFCATLVVLLLVFSVFSSCRKEPHFDNVPHIDFKSLTLSDAVDKLGNNTKNIDVEVSFKDGDGNLGLSTTLRSDSIGVFRSDTITHNNFFATLFVKQTQPDGTSEFVEFEFPNAGFDIKGRFPRISSADRPEPLEGTIKYTIPFTIDVWQMVAGKVARFEIYIYDRALNKSNIIITPEITLIR